MKSDNATLPPAGEHYKMQPSADGAAMSAMLSRLIHHRHVLKCGPRKLENRPAGSMGDDSMNPSNVLQCRRARANETHLSFYKSSASW